MLVQNLVQRLIFHLIVMIVSMRMRSVVQPSMAPSHIWKSCHVIIFNKYF